MRNGDVFIFIGSSRKLMKQNQEVYIHGSAQGHRLCQIYYRDTGAAELDMFVACI